MQKLSITRQKEIYAGGLGTGVYAAISAGISFIIGIFDGITRPFRCR